MLSITFFSSKALHPVTATPAHFSVGTVSLINGVNTLNLTHMKQIIPVVQCALRMPNIHYVSVKVLDVGEHANYGIPT